MSYYHRALLRLQWMENRLTALQHGLRRLDQPHTRSLVRLTIRGALKGVEELATIVHELREILKEWRYEPWTDLSAHRPPDADEPKENEE